MQRAHIFRRARASLSRLGLVLIHLTHKGRGLFQIRFSPAGGRWIGRRFRPDLAECVGTKITVLRGHEIEVPRVIRGDDWFS